MASDPRSLLEVSRYMTLATSDAEGRSWVTPVWFAAPSPVELLWVSDPNARHSRNIAQRPELAIVVFDSTVAPSDTEALYMEATAALANEGIERFSEASVASGLAEWTIEDVRPPAKHRLYVARVKRRWVLGPGDERIEVAPD